MLNFVSATTTNRKRQSIESIYTIAVVNPTLNNIISSPTFPSEILRQVLNDNQEQFFNGTGLVILSVIDNNSQEEFIFNLKILAVIVLPVVVVFFVVTLTAGIITIVVVR